MEQDEKFSDDPQENLRIENELMKIKLKAQYGDAFQMDSSEALPPDVENQFLKNILAFEESYNKGDFVTVYDRIGKPDYKPVEEMETTELKESVQQLLELLNQHQINLDFSDGPYDDTIVYQFITEELFSQEVEKDPVDGMIMGYIYEEFHPNHKAAIERCTHQFLKEWFTRSFSDNEFILSQDIITADGIQMQRDELLDKLRLFFDAFKNFGDDGCTIDDTSFELQLGNERGMGFAEGMLKYDAEIDNSEIIHFEGPYKLYMQMEYNEWSVFYFVMPGFKW
jgi:hypothetical protein